MDREIVREGNGGAGNVILGVVVAILIILAVWAFATGRFGNNTAEAPTDSTNINVDVPSPAPAVEEVQETVTPDSSGTAQ